MAKEQKRSPERRRPQAIYSQERGSKRLWRKLLPIGAGLVIIGGGLGITRPWDRFVSTPTLASMEQQGVMKISPDIDHQLVSEIVDLEGKYDRYTIPDSPERRRHLELSADIFSRYSGENLSKDQLIQSVVWQSNPPFEKKYTNGPAAVLEPKEKKVYFKEGANLYMESAVKGARKIMPHWSALTQAEIFYYHEWFHLAGAEVERVPDPQIAEMLKEGSLDDSYKSYPAFGFSLRYYSDKTRLSGADNTIEEAYAYYLIPHLTQKVYGTEIKLSRIEELQGDQAIYTNAIMNRFTEIFKLKPTWLAQMQNFHAKSDIGGFVRFLADNSGQTFENSQQRDQYGVDLINDVRSPKGQEQFKNYLNSIQSK